jgi:hypothetical protein
MHYKHHAKEILFFCNKMHSKKIETIIVLFNNYLLTLQLNLPLGLWHDLVIYEPHSSFRMDSG